MLELICDLVDLSMKVIDNLNQNWSNDNGLKLACVLLSLCGISNLFKKVITVTSIIVFMFPQTIDTIFQSYIGLESKNYLDFFLMTTVYCFISTISRTLEKKYGPKHIPCVQLSFLSPSFILRYLIRKVRQTPEFIMFSFLPGLIIYSFVTNRSWTVISQNVHDGCKSMNQNIFAYLWNALQHIDIQLVFSIAICVLIKRVFGSNPSYKSHIYDQYGHALPKNNSYSNLEDNMMSRNHHVAKTHSFESNPSINDLSISTVNPDSSTEKSSNIINEDAQLKNESNEPFPSRMMTRGFARMAGNVLIHKI